MSPFKLLLTAIVALFLSLSTAFADELGTGKASDTGEHNSNANVPVDEGEPAAEESAEDRCWWTMFIRLIGG